jgi:hypothetical protein
MDERAARAWLASLPFWDGWALAVRTLGPRFFGPPCCLSCTAPSRAGAGFPSETADQVAQALEDAGIDLVADLD